MNKNSRELIWRFETYCWETRAVLPSWVGFQSRRGAYGSQDQEKASEGIVDIVFAPEGRGGEPLSSAEVALVTWVIEHESEISQALIAALMREYPSMQKKYKEWAKEWGDDITEQMPDLQSAEDLRPLISLHSVNVHQVQKDGVPYAGFEFGCTWEQEHGLGALMHGTRTVKIGWADTAFLLWIAERDGGLPILLE